MSLSNKEIAAKLRQFADMLEIHADNPYRIKAYRRAARYIEQYSREIEQLLHHEEDLTVIPYVGAGIATIIKKMIETGQIPELFKKNDFPKQQLTKFKDRAYRYKIAELIVTYLMEYLESIPDVQHVFVTGSYRRRHELVGDIMFVIICAQPSAVMNAFIELPIVKGIIKRDAKRLSVLLTSSLKVTLLFTNEKNLAIQLLQTTGSATHVAELEKIAKTKNQKLSGKSEKEIYEKIGLHYIEPELRENRGEIAASITGKLPTLVRISDMKGDLHSHTNETDGVETLENMVNAAIAKGYHYLAITDHSKRLAITNGLDEKRLLKQIKKIDKMNERLSNFIILKSIEVDILEDGRLDLSNDVLKELDLCVCSIHSRFRMPEDKQTERIIRAMDNPYFNILGHATGRLLISRPPYPLQMERIMQAAKDRNCFLELNGQPARLDIHDEYCLMAKNIGLKIAISSDAHSIRELDFVRFGVNQARRGWLTKEDVINTRELPELKKLLKRR